MTASHYMSCLEVWLRLIRIHLLVLVEPVSRAPRSRDTVSYEECIPSLHASNLQIRCPAVCVQCAEGAAGGAVATRRIEPAAAPGC